MSKVQVNKVDNRVFNKAALRLLAAGAFSLFIAAPTPGNTGGCGNGVANVPLVVQPNQTAEYAYFDRALCAGFCQRLLDCGALCSVLSAPPGGDVASCMQNQQAAYELCIRGNTQLDGNSTFIAHYFPTGPDGRDSNSNNWLHDCPHACPAGTFQMGSVYEGDVSACNDGFSALSCSAMGAGSIGEAFNSALPLACVNHNICRQ